MADITLTITPSNQEDFLNALAQKIIDLGMDQQLLEKMAENVVENIDYTEIDDNILERVDYDEVRSDIIRDIEPGDLVECIDLYDLSRDVVDHIDADDIIQHTNLGDAVDEEIRQASMKHLHDFEKRLENLEFEEMKINKVLIEISAQLADLQERQNRSLWQRIFGG
jgi:hypothetical protein